jgi:hypothetical protein
MTRRIHRWVYCPSIALLISLTAGATSVPSLTFEELTDRSELILAGRITRSWSDWDGGHQFIWTHYELIVSTVQKGAPGSTAIVSEPGGVVADRGMAVAGSVAYRPGDQVAVFLERMPNGYLRTAGWGQGKYTVDKTGRLHADIHGIEVVRADQKSAVARGTSLRMLDGIGIGEFRARVAARVTTQHQGSAK